MDIYAIFIEVIILKEFGLERQITTMRGIMDIMSKLEISASDIMQDLAIRFFDNRCFVTHEKFQKRGFVIHHLKYIDEDRKRETFPKGEKGRLEYLKALKPMVEAQPFRFMLLKNSMHTKLDHFRNGLCRMKRENVNRLVVAYLLTDKKKTIKKIKSYKKIRRRK